MAASSDAGEPLLDFAAISTRASVLEDEKRLVLRYSDAILAYATAMLRNNREEAEDVHMHIVQSMLEGKFSHATSPSSVKAGRFRFYVQRAVSHAVLNHVRQRQRRQSLLQRFWSALSSRGDHVGKGTEGPPADADLEETERGIWRATVLSRAMEAALEELDSYEQKHQDRTRPNVYHTLARLMLDHCDDNSEQLAQRLGEQVGGAFNANQARGIVLRMRRKFADLLVAEIIPQLDDPTYDNVLDELCELGLFAYVKPYLPSREPPPGAE